MTVAITRTELDAAGLRAAASRCKDAAAARRMLALALVMEGHSRSEAARAAGMDRQTLRDWVHRYNESGLAGLYNTPERGRPPRKLTPEQEAGGDGGGVGAPWADTGAQNSPLALHRSARRDRP